MRLNGLDAWIHLCPDSFGSSKFHSSTAFLCAGARCLVLMASMPTHVMGQGGGSFEKSRSGEVGNLGDALCGRMRVGSGDRIGG